MSGVPGQEPEAGGSPLHLGGTSPADAAPAAVAATVSSGKPLSVAFRRYSTKLVAGEETAKAERRGLWRTVLEPPWVYRQRHWRLMRRLQTAMMTM